MRRSPLRERGVLPNSRRNSFFAHCEPLRIRNRQRVEQGLEMAERCGGFLLWGQQPQQRSQPKIHPSRSGRALSDSFSIVRTGDAAVRVDHPARRWLLLDNCPAVPAAAATGSCERASYWSDGRVSTNLAQQDIGAVLGRGRDCRLIQPRPASTASCFSSSGAVSTNVPPSRGIAGAGLRASCPASP